MPHDSKDGWSNGTVALLSLVGAVGAAVIVGLFSYNAATSQSDAENSRAIQSTLETRAASFISTVEKLDQVAGSNTDGSQASSIRTLNVQATDQFYVLLLSSQSTSVKNAALKLFRQTFQVGLDGQFAPPPATQVTKLQADITDLVNAINPGLHVPDSSFPGLGA